MELLHETYQLRISKLTIKQKQIERSSPQQQFLNEERDLLLHKQHFDEGSQNKGGKCYSETNKDQIVVSLGKHSDQVTKGDSNNNTEQFGDTDQEIVDWHDIAGLQQAKEIVRFSISN